MSLSASNETTLCCFVSRGFAIYIMKFILGGILFSLLWEFFGWYMILFHCIVFHGMIITQLIYLFSGHWIYSFSISQ